MGQFIKKQYMILNKTADKNKEESAIVFNSNLFSIYNIIISILRTHPDRQIITYYISKFNDVVIDMAVKLCYINFKKQPC